MMIQPLMQKYSLIGSGLFFNINICAYKNTVACHVFTGLSTTNGGQGAEE